MALHYTVAVVTLSYFVQRLFAQTCEDYSGSCISCVTQTDVSGCAYCPSSSTCIDTSQETCIASLSGQLSYSEDDCYCLTATTCHEMTTKNLFSGRGFCPYYSKCFSGNSDGPHDDIICPTGLTEGQWIYNVHDCQCASATSCEDMNDKEILQGYYNEKAHGWCPYYNKCFQGNDEGPFDDIDCPRGLTEGQWIVNNHDCLCTSATSCEDMNNKAILGGYYNEKAHGWCPYHNKCFQGNDDGPYDNINCRRGLTEGQWIVNNNDCLCTTATSCDDMIDKEILGGYYNQKAHGWCPYYNKCFQGNNDGPYDNINCSANAEKGQWVVNRHDCSCLSATSCEDMHNKGVLGGYYNERAHGWCPFWNTCLQGNGDGPYDELECPAGPNTGQWVSSIDDCTCLKTSSCNVATSFGSHGWCASNKRCYQGNGDGPYDNVECSSWSTDSNSCSQKCAANCVQCNTDSATKECTECKHGYNGEYCQYDILQCNLCKASAQKTMEAGMVAVADADCIEVFTSTFESCGTASLIADVVPVLGWIATFIVDPVVCTAAGFLGYKYCDKALTEIPAEKYCQSANVCPPDGEDRRRLIGMDEEPYPFWPFSFWIEGIQYSDNVMLNFSMGYSYIDNLMYSEVTNEQYQFSSYYILKNGTNYYAHKDLKNDSNNECNYTLGAIGLSEANYLESYLQRIGVDKLTYNGTLADNESISVWYSSICRNVYNVSNSTNSTGINGTQCGVQFYYYDIPIKDQNNETLYRKPLFTTIIANMHQITTKFHTFVDSIPDLGVFDEISYHCEPTSNPTVMPTLMPTDSADIIQTTKHDISTSSVDPYSTKNHEDDSDNQQGDARGKTSNGAATIAIVVVVVVVIVLALLGLVYYRKRQKKQPFTTNLDYQQLKDEPVNTDL